MIPSNEQRSSHEKKRRRKRNNKHRDVGVKTNEEERIITVCAIEFAFDAWPGGGLVSLSEKWTGRVSC